MTSQVYIAKKFFVKHYSDSSRATIIGVTCTHQLIGSAVKMSIAISCVQILRNSILNLDFHEGILKDSWNSKRRKISTE